MDLATPSDGTLLATGSKDRGLRIYTSNGGHFVYDHKVTMEMDIDQVYVTNDKSKIFVGGQSNDLFIL